MNTHRRRTYGALVTMLLLSTLACRPVVTVGYTEILIVAVIGIILLGPLVFRLYRFIARFQSAPPPSSSRGNRKSKRVSSASPSEDKDREK